MTQKWFLRTYLKESVIAHICKNNFEVKHEHFFLMSQQINKFISNVKKCLKQQNNDCIQQVSQIVKTLMGLKKNFPCILEYSQVEGSNGRKFGSL